MNIIEHPVNIPALSERLSKLDTAAVADALDSLRAKQFVLPGVRPRTPGTIAAGPAFTVRYRSLEDATTFHNAANYIDDVPAGAVIVVDNAGSESCTTWGSLLTSVAQSNGIAGTIVYGSARDVKESCAARYPLFSTDVTMVSGKNRVIFDCANVDIDICGTSVAPGDWIFADDNGALRIPASLLDEVLRRAEAVDRTEKRIRDAVLEGNRLEQARATYGYARPWEENGLSDAK